MATSHQMAVSLACGCYYQFTQWRWSKPVAITSKRKCPYGHGEQRVVTVEDVTTKERLEDKEMHL